MKHLRVWLLILLSLPSLGFVTRASNQETNMVHIRAIVNVSDIDFKEGKLTFYGLHLDVEVNKSFGVYLFAPSMYANNYWDEPSHYDRGWYSLWRQYFPTGIEMKFNFKEWVFCNEVLECGIVFGLNVTAHKDTRNIDADLNVPLKDEWDINGTIVKVSKEEAALYTVHGMSAINSSIRNRNIKEFYLLRIQVNRKPNIENLLIWLPPIFMLVLLLVSILLVYKRDLANSLRVYLTVAFFSFGYISMLREITPPTMTSIEDLTLIDAIFCLLLSIIVIVWSFKEKKELREGEKSTSLAESGVMNEKEENDFLELAKKNPSLDEDDLRIILETRIERPSKTFYAITPLFITVLVALISLQVYYTLPGFIVGIVFMFYGLWVIWVLVRNVPRYEMKVMRQYLKAKEFVAQRKKTEKT